MLATGGYIGASQEANDGDRSVATITYRVPASRWEDALASLRGLATEVVGEQTQATEVGGQLVDIEARLRNLRASEQVLVDIAKGTGKVTDLLEVEARIADVRGQIEQLDGQRLQLQDQVAYGTLVATFGTEIVQVQETAKGWDPTSDVDGATATLIGAGQAIVSGAIWFGIVWLPVILVLLVIALIARWAFRRFMPKPDAGRAGPGLGWRQLTRVTLAGGGALRRLPRQQRGPRPLTGEVPGGPALERRVRAQLLLAPRERRDQRVPVRLPEPVPRVHDRHDRLVAELGEVVRVETRAAAGRHERRVDRPLQVPLRHERLRADRRSCRRPPRGP